MKRILLIISFCAMHGILMASNPPDKKEAEEDGIEIEIVTTENYGDAIHFSVPCSTFHLRTSPDAKQLTTSATSTVCSTQKLLVAANAPANNGNATSKQGTR